MAQTNFAYVIIMNIRLLKKSSVKLGTQSIHTLSWVGAWKAEIVDNQTLRLTSAMDTSLGMQTVREFRLLTDSAVLTIKLTGINITNKPLVRHFWGWTLVKPGGTMILPINPRSRFEHGWGQILWGPAGLKHQVRQMIGFKFNQKYSGFMLSGTHSKAELMPLTAGWHMLLTACCL